ncbi:MAG TPA: YihY/virulence factor BrkB family protein [Gemmatimonadaceae bacterium]|nr:YihY/virulence factor BrkB family protein [Gemmatimonadaceae bacterium]
MELLKRVWGNILKTDVLGLAAQTAYFFFFSLFPLLLFTAPFLSLVGNKAATVGIIMQALARSVPPDAYLLIQNVVNDVVFAKNAPGVVSVGAILTIWAGSNVFSALIDALNHAFAVNDSRPWWRRTLICFAFVIGAALVGLIATVVLLDGEQVVQIITGFFGLGETTRFIWTVLEFPIAVAFVVLLMWAVYYVLPDLRLSGREALIGAVVASAAWIVVTLVFRIYVQHFGNYNKTYGTIGAVVILLTWMYLTMLSVLSAGVLAAELHSRHTGAPTGADLPKPSEVVQATQTSS